MIKPPSSDDLDAAAAWLDSYEPAPGETGNPCARVAEWLRAESEKRLIAETAKDLNVSVAHVRALLRKKAEEAGTARTGRQPHLTPEQAQEARELYSQRGTGPSNWTVSALARSFKVSQAVIHAVLDHKGAYGKGPYARKSKEP